MVYHATGRQTASLDQSLFSVKIVQPGAETLHQDSPPTEQFSVMPPAADTPFHAMSFFTPAYDFRQQEVRAGRDWERPVPCPDARFFQSLEGERATHRIERPCGIKGEGPAIFFNSTSLRVLMADSPVKAFELLERYYPVYCASFPDPDERFPFDTIVRLVRDSRFSIDVDVFTDQRGIIGGYQTHVATIEGETYSLGDYLCIDNRMKGLGIGPLVYRTTIEHRRDQFGVSAHFGEINDPRLMDLAQQTIDKKSGTDPDARLKFWSKQGRRMLDVPWVQPATAEGLSPVDYTMLTVHEIGGSKPLMITGETVMKIWDAYYLPLRHIAPILETREEMSRLLEPYRGRPIALKNLTESRSFMARNDDNSDSCWAE